MKQFLYIHIGLPKTGSSSLQAFFRTNADRLKDCGIVYPDLMGRNIGNATAAALSLLGDLPQYFLHNNPLICSDPKDFEGFWKQLLEKAASGKALLVSSEEFSLIPPYELFRRTASEAFDRKVIAVIRRQDMAIEKSYLQSIKAGLFQGSYEEYLHDVLMLRNHQQGVFDYRWLLSELSDHFGSDNVHVIRYDENWEKNSLFREVLSVMELDLDKRFEIPPRLNKSWPILAAEYLRHWRLEASERGQINSLVINLVKKNESWSALKGRLSSPEQIDRIAGNFSKSNSWVAEKFFDKASDKLFEWPSKDCGQIEPEILLSNARELHKSVMQFHWVQKLVSRQPQERLLAEFS